MGSSASRTVKEDTEERTENTCNIQPQSAESARARSLPPEKQLTSFLQHIFREKHIGLNEEETKKNVEIMKKAMSFLLSKMQEVDDRFKVLYREFYYTGSYYDGLRISSASEFDLNAVLVFPFKKEDRQAIAEDNCPSFAKYRLNGRASDLLAKMTKSYPAKIADFFDAKNYLIPEEICKWLQSVMYKTVQKYSQEIISSTENHVSKITVKRSGPAWTLLLQKHDGQQIDIDFVPVIQFNHPEWPKNADPHTLISDEKHGTWFLVPKKYIKKISPREPKDEDVPRLWRLHLPNIERKFIRDNGLVKPIIKLLKKLRDEEDWTILASYYLKTLVMWEIVDKDEQYWKGELGQLFIDMLRKLSQRVRARNLPYFIYPQYNLLNAMNEKHAINVANRIDYILHKIINNPRSVLQFFGCRCSDVLSTLP